MKVRDFTKIPLQQFAITVQPDRFAVVAYFGMNELIQLDPILPVETIDIRAIGVGETRIGQSICCPASLEKGSQAIDRFLALSDIR